jgi:hypothetical protein
MQTRGISMPLIPFSINGVQVQFAGGVGNDVDQKLVNGLKQCIKVQIAAGHTLSSIYVSSAYDSHEMPSRHMQHKAVDVSRINGTKIAIGYPQGGSVTAIVDAIQNAFEGYSHKRENFGPHLKRKLGQPWNVSAHNDHIHLSVN